MIEVKFSKIAIIINALIISHYAGAIDYTSPITGSKIFENGDSVVVSGEIAAISDTTSGGAGIQINDNGAISITATDTTYGLRLINHVENDLGRGSSIFMSDKANPYGVDVRSNGTVLTARDLNITLVSTNAFAKGFNIESGAKVVLEGHSTVTSNAGTGILLMGLTNNVSSFRAEQVTIDMDGVNVIGVQTQQYTEADLGDGSLIDVKGSGALGILNSGGSLIAKNLTVIQNSTDGTRGKGVDIRGVADIDGGSITVIDGNGMSVAFGGSLDYKNANISTSGSSSYALSAQTSNSVATTANLDNVVLTVNTSGYGIWANGDGSQVNAHDVTINAKGTHAGAFANNQSIISFTGDTAINAESSGIAGTVDGNGSQLVTGMGGSKMTINGSLYAQNQGVINLDMQQDSYLKGLISTDSTATTELMMTGTTWDMTDNSMVTNLTAKNSVIKFLSTYGNYKTLEVANFTGTDTNVGMNVDLGGITSTINSSGERIGTAGINGDLLIVTNAVGSNRNTLTITNNGSSNTKGNEVLQVVTTPDNNTGSFALAKSVEAGAYEYSLRESIDDNANKKGWELYSTGKKSSTADAATSFINIGYLTSYIDNQTLLQRLGDLRNNKIDSTTDNGVWIKSFGGKLSSFSSNNMNGFDMSYIGTQLGIDKNIDIENGRLLIGLVTGFTHTNPNYRNGNGSGRNYTAGLYATYFNSNGIYIDNIIKYNNMRNQFNVKDTAGNSVKGTGKTQGIMLSSEFGKRFWLSNEHQGFYLEPQAQLSYGYQNGDTVRASNGLKVSLSHYNSTLGRISAIVGYQMLGENPINIYAKTGVIREMSGGASYRFNDGDKQSHSFRSNWFSNGVGTNITINKIHNIYAEADYTTGNLFDDAMLNVGYRYSF